MNKLLAIISALTICFSLTACGDTGSEKSADTTAETTTTTAKPTETTTTAPPETTTTTEATTTTVAETEPPVEEDKGPVLKKKDRYAIATMELDYLGTSQLYETEEYDEKGNIISYIKYIQDHKGTIDSTTTYEYKYDEHNNILEMLKTATTYYSGSDRTDKYSSKNIYEYTSDNKLSKEKIYHDTENFPDYYYYRTYEYDENGNLITRKEYYDDKEAEDSRYTYKYDDKGNLIEEKKADYEKTEYEYDEGNNLIKLEVKTKYADATEWTTVHSCKYEYDSSGNVTREYDNWYGMTPKVIDYEYDENNNVTFSREYNKIEEDYGYSKDYGYAEIDGNGYFYWDYTYENTYY